MNDPGTTQDGEVLDIVEVELALQEYERFYKTSSRTLCLLIWYIGQAALNQYLSHG